MDPIQVDPEQINIAQFIQDQIHQQVQAAVNQAALNQAPQPAFGAQGHNSSIKPTKPEKFKAHRLGEPTILDNFLFQNEQYFDITQQLGAFWTDYRKVLFASNLFDGAALTWWRSLSQERRHLIQESWEEFKREVSHQFKPINSEQIAREKLDEVRQRTSVSRYDQEFLQITTQFSGLDEQYKIHRYVAGLKPHIQKEVYLRNPQSVMEAMTIAERTDLVTMKISKTSSRNEYRRKLEQDSHHRGQASYQQQSYTSSAEGATPMELGSIQGRTKDIPKSSLRCTVCGRIGHTDSTCWMKHPDKRPKRRGGQKYRPSNQSGAKTFRSQQRN